MRLAGRSLITDQWKEFFYCDALDRDVLVAKALENREKHTTVCETMEEIKAALVEKGDGFIRALWCESEDCEDKVKEETGVGSRCIPFEGQGREGVCVCCGKPAKTMVLWAKAY